MSPHDISCAIIALTVVMSLSLFEGWGQRYQEEESIVYRKPRRQYIRRF